MREKKPVLLLASAAALTLAMHGVALAGQPAEGLAPTAPEALAASDSAAPAGDTEAATQESADTTSSTPQEGTPPAPSAPGSQSTSPETAPDQQPGETPTSPTATGPNPPLAPQPATVGRNGAQAKAMSLEERIAQREQRFRKMRERFNQRRQEMTDRWDSYWKILDDMTPEQKEAIEAVFGRARRGCSPWATGPKMPPRMPMRPPFSEPDIGFPSGSGDPGEAYGPQGADPFPFGRGPSSPWGGEPPIYPGNAGPGYDMNPGFPQGPPPPKSD